MGKPSQYGHSAAGNLETSKRDVGDPRRYDDCMDSEYREDDRNYPSSTSSGEDDIGDTGWTIADDLRGRDDDDDGTVLEANRGTPSGDDGARDDGHGGVVPGAEVGRNDRRLSAVHYPICQEEGATLMEGGRKNLRLNTKAEKSKTYPFTTISHLLFMQLATKHLMSRVMLDAVLYMLRFKDEESGEGFDINDLEGVSAEHFVSRTRECMPLYEVYKTTVRGSPAAIAAEGPDATAEVYVVPANLIADRQLQSRTAMETFLKNPGGKTISKEEQIASNLSSPHIFCGPERPLRNKRRANMHGVLARSSPHFGYDGIRPAAGSKGRTIHVNDVAMCSLGPVDAAPRTCRVLELFWDSAAKKEMVALVRPFFSAAQVSDRSGGGRHLTVFDVRFLRLWEPLGKDESVIREIGTRQILDLCEIYSEASVRERKSKPEEWELGARQLAIQPLPCVGVSFLTSTERGDGAGTRKRSTPGGAVPSRTQYKVSEPWSLEGTEDEPLFTIRGASYVHNVRNLPFVSMPLVLWKDGFNAHGLGTKKSIGGSYLGWAWNSSALQRRKEETHIATVASPGASCEGELTLQCKIVHELEKGCIASAKVRAGGKWVTIEVCFALFISRRC